MCVCITVSWFELVKGNLPWRVGASPSAPHKDRQPINNPPASAPTYPQKETTHTDIHTLTHTHYASFYLHGNSLPVPLPSLVIITLICCRTKGCESRPVITAPLSELSASRCREAANAYSFKRFHFLSHICNIGWLCFCCWPCWVRSGMSHDWGKHHGTLRGRKQQEGLPHCRYVIAGITQLKCVRKLMCAPSNSVLLAFVTWVHVTHTKSPGFFLFPAITAAVHTWEPVDSIHKFLWLQRQASICSWHHSPQASLSITLSLPWSRREFKVLFGNWADI